MGLINKPEKKAPKPHIGARVEQEVYAEILRLKETTGKTESELINEAITAHFGIAIGATVPDRLSNVESRLDQQIEQRFEKLEQQVETILGKFTRLATR